MKNLFTLLDGPSLGGLIGAFSLFIVLPLVAIVLLIVYFVRRSRKNKPK
jgi:hypothetical protein